MPACANMQQLVSNAKKTLDFMLGSDEDLMGFNSDPLPVVNCVNGEVWLDKDGKPELRPHDSASRLTSCLPVAFDPRRRARSSTRPCTGFSAKPLIPPIWPATAPNSLAMASSLAETSLRSGS